MAASVATPVASVPTLGTNTSSAGTPGVSNQNIIPTIAPSVLPNPAATTAANPYATATGTIPSISGGLSTYNGDYTVAGDFTQVYGQGTGTALINTLAGLGTATDSAVQATSAESYANAQKASAGITSQEAAAGISKDSSTSALAQGDFWSSWSTGLNSTISNMELGEENTLISALQGEGTAHGGDVSTWDNVLEGINDAVGVAGTFFGGGFSKGIPGQGGGNTSITDSQSSFGDEYGF